MNEVQGGNEVTVADSSCPESKTNVSSEIILSPSSVVLTQSPLEMPNGDKGNSEM